MTRYYFDTRDGDEFIPDQEGMELSGLGRVQEQASRTLTDLARDMALPDTDGYAHPQLVEVRDDDGPVFAVLHVRG